MVGICVDGGGDGEPGAIPDEVCVWEWECERVRHYYVNKTIYTLFVISIYIIFDSIPLMVVIIPPSADANAPANPTRSEIDAYILSERNSDSGAETLRGIAREIECKSGAGALLHPAEEYFAEAVAVR